MTNREFWMGGFRGNMPFGAENLKEKWNSMTDDEKKKFVEKKVELMNEHFSKDGGHRFGEMTVEEMNSRCEEWMKMSDEEKTAFVDKRNERIKHFRTHFAH